MRRRHSRPRAHEGNGEERARPAMPGIPVAPCYENMMRVSTFIGSIVDPALGAHAIINASNPEVALGSGVSGAIRDACGGSVFQQLVRDAWKDEFDEPLEPGDCLVTGAGSYAAFRWVLHVPAV